MKGNQYLSSARTYALVMLLAAYLGLDLARSYAERVGLLVDARRSFAAAYVHENYAGKDLSAEIAGVGRVLAREAVAGGTPAFSGMTVYSPGERKFLVTVARPDRRRWAVEITYVQPSSAAKPGDAPPGGSKTAEFTQALKRIAIDAGLSKVDKEEDYVQIFRDIDFALVEQQVKIPGLELAARKDAAPWVIALLIVALMVQVRNQIRRVFLDETLALDEPWLILDAGGRLEKLVATGWIAAIFLAPWAAVASVLMVASGRIIADGALTTWFKDAIVSGAIMLLIAVGGWLSVSVVSDLLRLRRLRRHKLAELAPAATGASRHS